MKTKEAAASAAASEELVVGGDRCYGPVRSGHGGTSLRRSRSNILRATEAQNWDKDEAEQKQTNTEANALPERLRQIDGDDDQDDEVHEWDKHKQEPPPRATDDFEQHDRIIDRDDRSPARLAGFGENLPERGDQEHD